MIQNKWPSEIFILKLLRKTVIICNLMILMNILEKQIIQSKKTFLVIHNKFLKYHNKNQDIKINFRIRQKVELLLNKSNNQYFYPTIPSLTQTGQCLILPNRIKNQIHSYQIWPSPELPPAIFNHSQ
jgi:hypothetical protein